MNWVPESRRRLLPLAQGGIVDIVVVGGRIIHQCRQFRQSFPPFLGKARRIVRFRFSGLAIACPLHRDVIRRRGAIRQGRVSRCTAKREDDRVFRMLFGGVGFRGKYDVKDGESDGVPDGEPGDQMFVARSLALNKAHNTSCLIS